MDISKKYNYKIRIKQTGRFIAGNGSKTTWMRPTAVRNKIISLSKNKGPSFDPNTLYEIVLIPINEMETVSISDFLGSFKLKDELDAKFKINRERINLKNKELVELKILRRQNPKSSSRLSELIIKYPGF